MELKKTRAEKISGETNLITITGSISLWNAQDKQKRLNQNLRSRLKADGPYGVDD